MGAKVQKFELYRRMVFNILANNTDDHHKNFTFVMNRQGTWRLSPAYDMTYIFDTGGYLPNKEHCLMIGGKLLNGHTVSNIRIEQAYKGNFHLFVTIDGKERDQ